jgi:hypothetical protein
MKTLTHVDPNDFKETQLEYDDFHCELANRLRELLSMEAEDDETITEIMPNQEGNLLLFGLIKREVGQKGEKFKITIEKLDSDEK